MKPELFQLHADMEQVHWWFVGRREIMRQLVHAAILNSHDATIVDVGCGTGANIGSLADDFTCVGIDPSPDAIALAAQRFPGVTFIQGIAPDGLGPVAGGANLFLLMDVLEHVEDDWGMLSRLLAASMPGAQFLITVPAEPSLWSAHDVSFGHYRRYDRAEFGRLWEGQPVRVRLASYFNSRLYPVVKAVRTANRLRGSAAGREDTDLGLPPAPLNRLLERVFAGEARTLLDCLDAPIPTSYHRGVSLIAILQREAGDVVPRSRVASTYGQGSPLETAEPCET